MTNTATTATQSVTIYGPNLPRELSDRGDIVAHRTGCADTKRGAYRHRGVEGMDDPEAYEGYRGGVYVFPCVDLPEHVEV